MAAQLGGETDKSTAGQPLRSELVSLHTTGGLNCLIESSLNTLPLLLRQESLAFIGHFLSLSIGAPPLGDFLKSPATTEGPPRPKCPGAASSSAQLAIDHRATKTYFIVALTRAMLHLVHMR